MDGWEKGKWVMKRQAANSEFIKKDKTLKIEMYSILSLGFFTGHFRFNFFAKEKKQSIDMLLCFSNITVFGKVGT